jgi:hypothetical protein
MVTGTTTYSRLAELKKYAIGVPFNQQYVGDGSLIADGVDFTNSTSGVSVTYYIGGIKYVDNISAGITTYSVTAQGSSSADFINVPYQKNPTKENIISNPKIVDDVFITRQELSAFDKNYRLEYVRNLNDIITYAGGKFFNIVNNT